jgi:hypothetical protein
MRLTGLPNALDCVTRTAPPEWETRLGAKERVTERGTLGLFVADQPMALVSDVALENKTRLDADTCFFTLRPEILAVVKSIEISARKPDGGQKYCCSPRTSHSTGRRPTSRGASVASSGYELTVTATASSIARIYRARR